MIKISSQVRWALLCLPVALSSWALVDTLWFIYANFGSWIFPDILLFEILFVSFIPVVYWKCEPSQWRKLYLVSAVSLTAFYAFGLTAVAISIYLEPKI